MINIGTIGITDWKRRRSLGCLAVLLLAGASTAPPRTVLHPRLSRTWNIIGYDLQFRPISGDAPFTPAGKAIFERRLAAYDKGTLEQEPPNQCRPHGVPRIMMSPYPFEIVDTGDRVTIFHEVAHNVRSILMNQPHPANVPLTYLGNSVGHWEGETLVVDTIRLRPETWIDEAGKPHSDKLHVVERMTPSVDGKTLDVRIRIEDPVYYTRPWETQRSFKTDATLKIAEYVCEDGLGAAADFFK